MDPDEHPFSNPMVRILIGLASAFLLVFIAFFVIEDTLMRWLIVGIAAIDAVTTPWLLKRVMENAASDEGAQYA